MMRFLAQTPGDTATEWAVWLTLITVAGGLLKQFLADHNAKQARIQDRLDKEQDRLDKALIKDTLKAQTALAEAEALKADAIRKQILAETSATKEVAQTALIENREQIRISNGYNEKIENAVQASAATSAATELLAKAIAQPSEMTVHVHPPAGAEPEQI